MIDLRIGSYWITTGSERGNRHRTMGGVAITYGKRCHWAHNDIVSSQHSFRLPVHSHQQHPLRSQSFAHLNFHQACSPHITHHLHRSRSLAIASRQQRPVRLPPCGRDAHYVVTTTSNPTTAYSPHDAHLPTTHEPALTPRRYDAKAERAAPVPTKPIVDGTPALL